LKFLAPSRRADELARKPADEKARTFRCGLDKPQSVGNRPPDD
jgi:hypothetical protein